MWPTTNGLRALDGDEAKLVCGAISMMVDQIVAESREEADQHAYGIDWFDGWDAGQRLWLLERAARALLTDADPPPAAAMLEATVDTIFAEVIDLIAIEIVDGNFYRSPSRRRSWRQSLFDAFVMQNDYEPQIHVESVDESAWQKIATQVADAILGVRLYQQAEAFRDGDVKRTKLFLIQKGLPTDFLEQIPPLQTVNQTQMAIDRIQKLTVRR